MYRTAAAIVALAGSSYALAGGAFPPSFEISSLDGLSGFVLEGIDAHDRSGHAVASAGDVNGDGFADLLIGAYTADPDGRGLAGECYVVFGGSGVGSTGRIRLSSLDGSNGFIMEGAVMGDRCGFSVSGAGDVNGDGFDDLIVGAYYASTEFERAGESYVVFGAAGIGAGGAGGVIKLSGLDGSDGFVLRGVGVADRSGEVVASAGDVNGDGFADLMIAAPQADSNDLNTGETYVVFGGPTVGASGVIELAGLNGINGFTLRGVSLNDFSGYSIAPVGDINHDGDDDLIIGAPFADPNAPQSGATYVVFGGAGIGASDVIELSSLTGADGFVLNGATEDERSGHSVAGVGDVNGDGVDDFIIGAQRADVGSTRRAGKCYTVFGAADIGAGGVIELADLDGTDGFAMNGIDRNDYCGISVASAGDVNGDGVNDLFVGASGADPNGRNGAGESYIVYGAAGLGANGAFEFSSINGSNGFVIHGAVFFDETGEAIASAGDVNGDGLDDLIIGAKYADPGGVIGERAGESYVVFGRSSNIPADFDGDGCVGSGDLAFLLAAWNGRDADLNGDDVTDSSDLAILLSAWGAGCE